jgi:hypothetical protein
MRHTIYVALILLVCVKPTWAEVRIKAGPGGNVLDFLKLFAELRHSGDRIVIDGPCLSACTLVLSTIPRIRICVTRYAIVGFHAPMLVDRYGDEFHARVSSHGRLCLRRRSVPGSSGTAACRAGRSFSTVARWPAYIRSAAKQKGLAPDYGSTRAQNLPVCSYF